MFLNIKKKHILVALVSIILHSCSGAKFSSSQNLAAPRPSSSPIVTNTPVLPQSPSPEITAVTVPSPTMLPGDDDEIIKRLEDYQAGSGDLQVSLIWNDASDLDLHIFTPQGEHVYFSNKTDSGGGYLDIDMNAEGTDCCAPIENYFVVQGEHAKGHYKVYVNYYNDFGTPSTEHYKVRLKVGKTVKILNGSLEYESKSGFGPDRSESDLRSQGAVLVTQFDY